MREYETPYCHRVTRINTILESYMTVLIRIYLSRQRARGEYLPIHFRSSQKAGVNITALSSLLLILLFRRHVNGPIYIDHLPIDSKGTQIFFTDSGAVHGSRNYTTIVCIHGYLFTGGSFTPLSQDIVPHSLLTCHLPAIFEHILPLAAPNNIRLVVINRRGYPGSTPYTADEKDGQRSGRKLFLETMGLQVVQFLNAFLDQNDIPRASSDGNSGGLALLGWSLGTFWALAPLGHSDAIPQSYLTRLEPYLKNCILLGMLSPISFTIVVS
jgi:hypothetical protein